MMAKRCALFVSKTKLIMKTLKLFTENAAPHGFGYIVSHEKVSRKRRVLWFLWIVTCCGVLINHVSLNIRRYLSFPSTIKVNTCFNQSYHFQPVYLNNHHENHFPQITICPNGIHSRQKIRKHYPKMISG